MIRRNDDMSIREGQVFSVSSQRNDYWSIREGKVFSVSSQRNDYWSMREGQEAASKRRFLKNKKLKIILTSLPEGVTFIGDSFD